MRPEVGQPPASYIGLNKPALVVGMGEARVLKLRPDLQPEQVLVAFGLGSCVAICLWDPVAEVAAMAHVVLPGEDPSGKPNPRFARSALPALLALMSAEGATTDPFHLVARLAGGALVLTMAHQAGMIRVGDANADAVVEVLETAGTRIEAVDLGGPFGRTVWFDPRERGRIRVRAIGGSTDRLL